MQLVAVQAMQLPLICDIYSSSIQAYTYVQTPYQMMLQLVTQSASITAHNPTILTHAAVFDCAGYRYVLCSRAACLAND